MTSLQRFLLDAGERAAKTFLQSYFAVWIGISGAAFDTLFTLDNLKAGVVGLALSVATSVASKQAGAEDSASLLPEDVDPPQGPDDEGVVALHRSIHKPVLGLRAGDRVMAGGVPCIVEPVDRNPQPATKPPAKKLPARKKAAPKKGPRT